MIKGNLPALLIVVPLLAAPLAVLFHNGKLAWIIALTSSTLVSIISVWLLKETCALGLLVYSMGGWAAPLGIELRLEVINALIAVIVTLASTVTLLFARLSVEKEIDSERIYLFYSLWLLLMAGLLGIAVTGDVFNLFVFLEISSLSSYALISLGGDRRALVAAFRYLVVGTVGATFILIGVGLLYTATGSLNMYDIAVRLPDSESQRTVKSAFAFLAVGVATKMAVFPFHFWLPNAYTYAPSVVTAFLAATATKVAIYVWLRLFFSIFGVQFSVEEVHLDQILMPLAMCGIIVASVVAVYQRDVKRILAYSSIAQVGYIVLGISFVTSAGLVGGVVHLINHALIKLTLFMAVGCVVFRVGFSSISSFNGLGRQMPLTMLGFVIAGLSLIGVPLTAGFISKWYLLRAAFDADLWFVVFVMVLGSLIAIVYVWKVVEIAYFREYEGVRVKEVPFSMLVPLWLLVSANIYFGVQTQFSVSLAEDAAAVLTTSWFY